MDQTTSLAAEIESFKGLWKGGYYVGDPTNPYSPSSYGLLGYLSVLHVTYLTCIRPYVNNTSHALEIGPGRGAWTKTMLNAKEVWCLDALSAEHNGFWEYLERPGNVKYFAVNNFKCEMLPSDYFDFLFSFGCFCHISPAGFEEYVTSLFPKLKSGAHAFIMVADYDKYNRAVRSLKTSSIQLVPRGRRYLPLRLVERVAKALTPPLEPTLNKNEDQVPRPGRWYHLGIDRACEIVERNGYKVIEPDVEANLRDPIVHFMKP